MRTQSIQDSSKPLLVHILLDHSSSMLQYKDIAHQAIQSFFELLKQRVEQDALFQISCFSAHYENLHGAFPIHDSIIENRAFSWLNEKIIDGNTALYDALCCALLDNRLAAHECAIETNALIVITDGEDNTSFLTPCEIGFPNPDIDLFAIGVTQNSLQSLRALSPHARQTIHVSQMNLLLDALWNIVGCIME